MSNKKNVHYNMDNIDSIGARINLIYRRTFESVNHIK